MNPRALLVDESAKDLKLAGRLEASGLPCLPLLPSPSLDSLLGDIADALGRGRANIVLLDYRLDEELGPEGGRPNYRGGAVAAAVKERFPTTPIVLVTSQEKLRHSLEANPRVRDLFDLEVMKRDLNDFRRRPVEAARISDLAAGFEKLALAANRARSKDPWVLLGRLLVLSKDEIAIVQRRVAGPLPVEPLDIISWLMDELLAYPGPLLADDEASASLGITREAFLGSGVQSFASSSLYDGVFSVVHRRWWRHRLEELLQGLFGDEAVDPGSRAAKIAGAIDERIGAAECVWCEGAEVVRACQVCKEPVDGSHSVGASMDERPPWADIAVVCFLCIQTGRADGIEYLPGSSDMVARVRSGGVPRR